MTNAALFPVTARDMRIEYAELADIKEFAELTTQELKFVWFYYNRTSPYCSIKNQHNKKAVCLEQSELTKVLSDDEQKKYRSDVFPAKIKSAGDIMEHFSPSARLQAKMTTELIFKNLQKIVTLDEKKEKEMDDDINMKKEYVNLSISVAKNMPDIVAQLEQGYGIRAVKNRNANTDGPTIMDTLHAENELSK